jgi:putative endonuclease
MKNYVYFLKSKNIDNWSYVGCTTNIEQRIKAHNSGKTRSTKAYIPLYIAHKEEFDTIAEARQKELYYKSSKGRREKAKVLKLNNSEIV